MAMEFSIKGNAKSEKDFNKLELMGLDIAIKEFFKKQELKITKLSLRQMNKKKKND